MAQGKKINKAMRLDTSSANVIIHIYVNTPNLSDMN